MVMACVKSNYTNYVMLVNPGAMNVVKTTHIHTRLYEEIASIDQAQ
jgi:hypothetical protein